MFLLFFLYIFHIFHIYIYVLLLFFFFFLTENSKRKSEDNSPNSKHSSLMSDVIIVLRTWEREHVFHPRTCYYAANKSAEISFHSPLRSLYYCCFLLKAFALSCLHCLCFNLLRCNIFLIPLPQRE